MRISGPDAFRISSAIFTPRKPLAPEGPHGPRFGRFLSRDGRPIDHGYLVRFDPPRSFTAEPSAELWAHGNPAILAALVEAAVAQGAEPAGPGEFTYRALRHGRLDLARAEGIRDLVAARTLYQARLAFSQAEGELSRRVAPLREDLAELITRAEAAVEFVDESETHLRAGELPKGIARARSRCAELLDGFRAGRLVREGATVVFSGRPNVGKSSLFNRLLRRDRAIVHPVPGTTRDTLEEGLEIGGIPIRLVDTAGLRDEGDVVEQEGVRRARVALEEADLVLLVLEAGRDLEPREAEALARLDSEADPQTVVVLNKIDLLASGAPVLPHADAVAVSARTGQGIERLRTALEETLLRAGPIEDPVVTDARHGQALEGAEAALARAASTLSAGFTEELILEDLREAIAHVGTITGAFTTEDLYDRIFSTFCIGK